MIFFPSLYNDEILYSLFARYHCYTGNENYKTTMYELFGSETVCSTILFPAHLKSLCQRFPANSYTPNELIKKHTALPYYTPFIPEERNQKLISLMAEDDGKSIYMKLGKTASVIKSPKYLYQCPKCVAEDISNNGEAYWHRTHQMEGVKVCPIHNDWLIETSIPFAESKNKHEFVCIEHCNLGGGETDTDRKEIQYKHLMFIAEQTYFILNNKINPFGLNSLNKYYITRLKQGGLASYTGRIQWRDLIPNFIKFYGKNLLKDFNCIVELDQQDTWLHKVLRKPRVSCHPLRHILLLGFLGETISTLNEQINSISYEPFGSGPWPCLNKAADHFKKPTIKSCVISRDTKIGSPVGTFSCSCGFIYSRSGPDKDKDDYHKIGRIKAFGPVWDQKLKELAKQKLSLRKKADILGVDPATVKNKLNSQEVTRDEVQQNNVFEKYRTEWFILLENNKEKTITEIRSMNPRVYTWLYRNDLEWLKDNCPNDVKHKKSISRIDWKARDIEIAKQVELIAKENINDTKVLRRITKNEVGRLIKELSLSSLYRNIEKMPKTQKALDNCLESVEQFQIRRIKSVARQLRETKSCVKEWELIRAAGLRREFIEKHKKIIQKETSS